MKIISLFLVVLFCISLCGCKKNAEAISSLPTSANSVSSDVESEAIFEQSTTSDSGSVQSFSSDVSSVQSDVSKPQTSSVVLSQPQHIECEHTFSVSTENPTCTKNGAETQICTKCFIEVKNVINATGHNMSDGKCTVCGYADVDACRNKVSNWLQSNHGGKYTLSDSRYYIKTAGGGNLFFYYEDGNNESIIIQIYGGEKNGCYIEYIKNENIEGPFPMDSVHSTYRIYFNQMNGTAEGEQKNQMITELRDKIDGMLLKFQEVMQSNIGVSLKDIGFTAY